MSRLVFLSIAIVLSLLPVVAPAAPAHNRPAPRWHGYGFPGGSWRNAVVRRIFFITSDGRSSPMSGVMAN
jgi:hypothetical protein